MCTAVTPGARTRELGVGEAAFGADDDRARHRARRALRERQRGRRRQDHVGCIRGVEPRFERHDRRHSRDPVAAALLARRLRDLPPVLDAACRAIALRAALAARRGDRLDARDAELDRLAHGDVHRIGGDHRHHQRQVDAGFALDIAKRVDRDPRAALVDAQERAAYSPPRPSNSVIASPVARRSTRVA